MNEATHEETPMPATDLRNYHPIADEIKRQIGAAVLMSCGAHDFQPSNGSLRFKVGGRLRYCEVTLQPGDTYSIFVTRYPHGHDAPHVTEYFIHDVYAEDLPAIVRREADRS